MSYFNSGGNVGYALGAFVTGQLVVWLGLVGGLAAMIPVFVVAIALARLLPYLARSRRRRTSPATCAATTGAGRWHCSES